MTSFDLNNVNNSTPQVVQSVSSVKNIPIIRDKIDIPLPKNDNKAYVEESTIAAILREKGILTTKRRMEIAMALYYQSQAITEDNLKYMEHMSEILKLNSQEAFEAFILLVTNTLEVTDERIEAVKEIIVNKNFVSELEGLKTKIEELDQIIVQGVEENIFEDVEQTEQIINDDISVNQTDKSYNIDHEISNNVKQESILNNEVTDIIVKKEVFTENKVETKVTQKVIDNNFSTLNKSIEQLEVISKSDNNVINNLTTEKPDLTPLPKEQYITNTKSESGKEVLISQQFQPKELNNINLDLKKITQQINTLLELKKDIFSSSVIDSSSSSTSSGNSEYLGTVKFSPPNKFFDGIETFEGGLRNFGMTDEIKSLYNTSTDEPITFTKVGEQVVLKVNDNKNIKNYIVSSDISNFKSNIPYLALINDVPKLIEKNGNDIKILQVNLNVTDDILNTLSPKQLKTTIIDGKPNLFVVDNIDSKYNQINKPRLDKTSVKNESFTNNISSQNPINDFDKQIARKSNSQIFKNGPSYDIKVLDNKSYLIISDKDISVVSNAPQNNSTNVNTDASKIPVSSTSVDTEYLGTVKFSPPNKFFDGIETFEGGLRNFGVTDEIKSLHNTSTDEPITFTKVGEQVVLKVNDNKNVKNYIVSSDISNFKSNIPYLALINDVPKLIEKNGNDIKILQVNLNVTDDILNTLSPKQLKTTIIDGKPNLFVVDNKDKSQPEQKTDINTSSNINIQKPVITSIKNNQILINLENIELPVNKISENNNLINKFKSTESINQPLNKNEFNLVAKDGINYVVMSKNDNTYQIPVTDLISSISPENLKVSDLQKNILPENINVSLLNETPVIEIRSNNNAIVNIPIINNGMKTPLHNTITQENIFLIKEPTTALENNITVSAVANDNSQNFSDFKVLVIDNNEYKVFDLNPSFKDQIKDKNIETITKQDNKIIFLDNNSNPVLDIDISQLKNLPTNNITDSITNNKPETLPKLINVTEQFFSLNKIANVEGTEYLFINNDEKTNNQTEINNIPVFISDYKIFDNNSLLIAPELKDKILENNDKKLTVFPIDNKSLILKENKNLIVINKDNNSIINPNNLSNISINQTPYKLENNNLVDKQNNKILTIDNPLEINTDLGNGVIYLNPLTRKLEFITKESLNKIPLSTTSEQSLQNIGLKTNNQIIPIQLEDINQIDTKTKIQVHPDFEKPDNLLDKPNTIVTKSENLNLEQNILTNNALTFQINKSENKITDTKQTQIDNEFEESEYSSDIQPEENLIKPTTDNKKIEINSLINSSLSSNPYKNSIQKIKELNLFTKVDTVSNVDDGQEVLSDSTIDSKNVSPVLSDTIPQISEQDTIIKPKINLGNTEKEIKTFNNKNIIALSINDLQQLPVAINQMKKELFLSEYSNIKENINTDINKITSKIDILPVEINGQPNLLNKAESINLDKSSSENIINDGNIKAFPLKDGESLPDYLEAKIGKTEYVFIKNDKNEIIFVPKIKVENSMIKDINNLFSFSSESNKNNFFVRGIDNNNYIVPDTKPISNLEIFPDKPILGFDKNNQPVLIVNKNNTLESILSKQNIDPLVNKENPKENNFSDLGIISLNPKKSFENDLKIEPFTKPLIINNQNTKDKNINQQLIFTDNKQIYSINFDSKLEKFIENNDLNRQFNKNSVVLFDNQVVIKQDNKLFQTSIDSNLINKSDLITEGINITNNGEVILYTDNVLKQLEMKNIPSSYTLDIDSPLFVNIENNQNTQFKPNKDYLLIKNNDSISMIDKEELIDIGVEQKFSNPIVIDNEKKGIIYQPDNSEDIKFLPTNNIIQSSEKLLSSTILKINNQDNLIIPDKNELKIFNITDNIDKTDILDNKIKVKIDGKNFSVIPDNKSGQHILHPENTMLSKFKYDLSNPVKVQLNKENYVLINNPQNNKLHIISEKDCKSLSQRLDNPIQNSEYLISVVDNKAYKTPLNKKTFDYSQDITSPLKVNDSSFIIKNKLNKNVFLDININQISRTSNIDKPLTVNFESKSYTIIPGKNPSIIPSSNLPKLSKFAYELSNEKVVINNNKGISIINKDQLVSNSTEVKDPTFFNKDNNQYLLFKGKNNLGFINKESIIKYSDSIENIFIPEQNNSNLIFKDNKSQVQKVSIPNDKFNNSEKIDNMIQFQVKDKNILVVPEENASKLIQIKPEDKIDGSKSYKININNKDYNLFFNKNIPQLIDNKAINEISSFKKDISKPFKVNIDNSEFIVFKSTEDNKFKLFPVEQLNQNLSEFFNLDNIKSIEISDLTNEIFHSDYVDNTPKPETTSASESSTQQNVFTEPLAHKDYKISLSISNGEIILKRVNKQSQSDINIANIKESVNDTNKLEEISNPDNIIRNNVLVSQIINNTNIPTEKEEDINDETDIDSEITNTVNEKPSETSKITSSKNDIKIPFESLINSVLSGKNNKSAIENIKGLNLFLHKDEELIVSDDENSEPLVFNIKEQKKEKFIPDEKFTLAKNVNGKESLIIKAADNSLKSINIDVKNFKEIEEPIEDNEGNIIIPDNNTKSLFKLPQNVLSNLKSQNLPQNIFLKKDNIISNINNKFLKTEISNLNLDDIEFDIPNFVNIEGKENLLINDKGSLKQIPINNLSNLEKFKDNKVFVHDKNNYLFIKEDNKNILINLNDNKSVIDLNSLSEISINNKKYSYKNNKFILEDSKINLDNKINIHKPFKINSNLGTGYVFHDPVSNNLKFISNKKIELNNLLGEKDGVPLSQNNFILKRKDSLVKFKLPETILNKASEVDNAKEITMNGIEQIVIPPKAKTPLFPSSNNKSVIIDKKDLLNNSTELDSSISITENKNNYLLINTDKGFKVLNIDEINKNINKVEEPIIFEKDNNINIIKSDLSAVKIDKSLLNDNTTVAKENYTHTENVPEIDFHENKNLVDDNISNRSPNSSLDNKNNYKNILESSSLLKSEDDFSNNNLIAGLGLKNSIDNKFTNKTQPINLSDNINLSIDNQTLFLKDSNNNEIFSTNILDNNFSKDVNKISNIELNGNSYKIDNTKLVPKNILDNRSNPINIDTPVMVNTNLGDGLLYFNPYTKKVNFISQEYINKNSFNNFSVGKNDNNSQQIPASEIIKHTSIPDTKDIEQNILNNNALTYQINKPSENYDNKADSSDDIEILENNSSDKTDNKNIEKMSFNSLLNSVLSNNNDNRPIDNIKDLNLFTKIDKENNETEENNQLISSTNENSEFQDNIPYYNINSNNYLSSKNNLGLTENTEDLFIDNDNNLSYQDNGNEYLINLKGKNNIVQNVNNLNTILINNNKYKIVNNNLIPDKQNTQSNNSNPHNIDKPLKINSNLGEGVLFKNPESNKISFISKKDITKPEFLNIRKELKNTSIQMNNLSAVKETKPEFSIKNNILSFHNSKNNFVIDIKGKNFENPVGKLGNIIIDSKSYKILNNKLIAQEKSANFSNKEFNLNYPTKVNSNIGEGLLYLNPSTKKLNFISNDYLSQNNLLENLKFSPDLMIPNKNEIINNSQIENSLDNYIHNLVNGSSEHIENLEYKNINEPKIVNTKNINNQTEDMIPILDNKIYNLDEQSEIINLGQNILTNSSLTYQIANPDIDFKDKLNTELNKVVDNLISRDSEHKNINIETKDNSHTKMSFDSLINSVLSSKEQQKSVEEIKELNLFTKVDKEPENDDDTLSPMITYGKDKKVLINEDGELKYIDVNQEPIKPSNNIKNKTPLLVKHNGKNKLISFTDKKPLVIDINKLNPDILYNDLENKNIPDKKSINNDLNKDNNSKISIPQLENIKNDISKTKEIISNIVNNEILNSKDNNLSAQINQISMMYGALENQVKTLKTDLKEFKDDNEESPETGLLNSLLSISPKSEKKENKKTDKKISHDKLAFESLLKSVLSEVYAKVEKVSLNLQGREILSNNEKCFCIPLSIPIGNLRFNGEVMVKKELDARNKNKGGKTLSITLSVQTKTLDTIVIDMLNLDKDLQISLKVDNQNIKQLFDEKLDKLNKILKDSPYNVKPVTCSINTNKGRGNSLLIPKDTFPKSLKRIDGVI